MLAPMRRAWTGHVAGALAAAFLGLAFLWPLGVILARSLEEPGAALATLGTSYYAGRLALTTGQALLSTLLTVAAGLPMAVLFARYDFRGKRLVRSAFTIPFVMPSVVAAIGFLALVGPNGALGVDLRGRFALVLLAHVFYNYAVVVRVVGGYLEAVAPRLQEAAATLGASGGRALRRVTLPLALPAVLAAAALVFSFTFTSFGVILILAPRWATLEVEIFRLTERLLRLDAAAGLALVQLAVVGVVTWGYARLQERLAVPLAGAVPLPRPRGAARGWLALNLVLAAALVLSPLVALAWQAVWPPGAGGPSLRAFASLARATGSIGVADAGPAILNSLRFALAASAIALAIGFLFAHAVVRGGWRWLDGLSLLPLATSAVTLGFGYLLAFPGLVASFWGIALAHALIGFPFVARSLLPALRGLPPGALAAAATLGAGPLRRLARVELPLLAPSLVTAASFAFAVSMGEFGAALILRRPEWATLPVAIFDRLGRPGMENYGAALALATVLMALTAAVMLLLERFGQSEL